MKFTVGARIKTQIRDAKTGQVLKESPWQKNLIFDIGLNGLANDATYSMQCNPASITRYCQIGSGTDPVKIASGAITFTQTGTTLTASGGFFTSSMVGGIFKWGTGTGGVEVYITSFTSDTVVTVATSAEVAAPELGAVWMVQSVALQTYLYESNTYQTSAGDCGTTNSGGQMVHKRTHVFPVQSSEYTVNEIGYSPHNRGGTGNRCAGRIVLSSSDVVGTTNFYVVISEFTVNWTPEIPTAVADLGVNFDTAGMAMIEWYDLGVVSSVNGNPTYSNGVISGSLDGGIRYSGGSSGGCDTYLVAKIGSAWTQALTIGTTAPNWGTENTDFLQVAPGTGQSWIKVSGEVGKCRISFAGSKTTSGQTCYGVGLSARTSSQQSAYRGRPGFTILFDTPQALPVGSWQPTVIFQVTYTRELEN